MVATFAWDEFNLVGKVQTEGISNVNWGNVDEPNIVITTEVNKVPIGENSFTKYIVGHFSGTFSLIGPNGKVWKSAGSLDAEVSLKGTVTVTYATPTKTASGDGVFPTTEGTALAVQFGDTPELASNDSEATNPCYTAYIRTQIQTTGSAPTGSIGSQTISLKYDES